MNFTSDTYIALASAIVSLCVMILTYWQGKQNYKHNKLSVKPSIGCYTYHDTSPDGIVRYTFKLMNTGIGPAVIKKFVLYEGDKEISYNNSKKYESFIKELSKDFEVHNYCFYAPKSVMMVGEEKLLLRFSYRKNKKNNTFVESLNFALDYQSIYEDEIFTFDSRKARIFSYKNRD